MYPPDIEAYISELYRRRDEGVVLPRAEMHGGNWQPQRKLCHDNVDTYCEFDRRYKPIRGWLFFDFDYCLDRVAFLQHSVLMFPDGTIFDITPAIASQDYPFIRVFESDEKFYEKQKYTDNGKLYYTLKNV